MLPLGHLAGGYLVSRGAHSVLGMPSLEHESLLVWGMAASVMPDLDMVYAFVRTRSATIDSRRANHRTYLSHRPLFWLAVSVPFILHAPDETVRAFGILLLCGSWTHFLLDSIQYGIQWLWPFSNVLYAYRDTGKELEIHDRRFVPFWKTFLVRYWKEFRLTSLAEVSLIALTLLIHYRYPL